MKKQNLIVRLKLCIADIGFRLFLFGNDTTEEEYWDQIYEQEKNFRE